MLIVTRYNAVIIVVNEILEVQIVTRLVMSTSREEHVEMWWVI